VFQTLVEVELRIATVVVAGNGAARIIRSCRLPLAVVKVAQRKWRVVAPLRASEGHIRRRPIRQDGRHFIEVVWQNRGVDDWSDATA